MKVVRQGQGSAQEDIGQRLDTADAGMDTDGTAHQRSHTHADEEDEEGWRCCLLVEPDDGVQVQVVGGLVQHQQGGLHEQGSEDTAGQHEWTGPTLGRVVLLPGQGDPHSPASREPLGGSVLHLWGEGQTS